MDDLFEKYEKNEENIIEKKFQENMKRQRKFLRLAMLLTFTGMGILFSVIGLVYILISNRGSADYEMGLTFFIMGIPFIISGIICFIAINPYKNISYEKYMARIKRFQYSNYYASQIQIQMLEVRVEQLEKKVKELENSQK